MLSHLILPNDLGLAIGLMSILAGCELVLDLGLDRFVMVTGADQRDQATALARQITILRALVLASVLVICAPELAAAFGARSAAGNVAWLGLVPVISSLRNWRLIQMQLEYRYWPEAVVSVTAQCAAIVGIVGGVAAYHDYRAILVGLFSEAVTAAVLSNMLVPRVSVRAIDPLIRKQAWAFCVPLMINGLFLMASKQLDQIFVVKLFDLKTLALYALSLNLALTPTSLLQAIVAKVGYPFLVAARDRGGPKAAAGGIVNALILAGTAYAVAIGLVLDRAVPLIYGAQYQVTPAFCALVMVVAFLRFVRGGPIMILLHHSATARVTLSTVIAACGPPIGFLLCTYYGRLEDVVIGLAAGDVMSLGALLWLIRRYVPFAGVIRRAGILGILLGVVAVAVGAGPLGVEQRLALMAAGGVVVVLDAFGIYRQITNELGTHPEPEMVTSLRLIASFVGRRRKRQRLL